MNNPEKLNKPLYDHIKRLFVFLSLYSLIYRSWVLRLRPSAPNYTSACIVMFGINLMWVLMVIWVVWGFLAAAVTGWAINHLIRRIGIARS